MKLNKKSKKRSIDLIFEKLKKDGGFDSVLTNPKILTEMRKKGLDPSVLKTSKTEVINKDNLWKVDTDVAIDRNGNFYHLYKDMVNWFWENSDKVNGKKITPTLHSQITKNIIAGGFYRIDTFDYQNNNEFLDSDGSLNLFMSLPRAKKLINYLIKKGWPKDTIYRIKDCPGFYRSKDDPLYYYFPIRWRLLREQYKNEVVSYFQDKGYKFHSNIRDNYKPGLYSSYAETKDHYGIAKLFH